MALILSTFFSVGRLLGMSNREVLTQGLGQFIFTLPTLLVWIVGLGMAIRRRKRNRRPAILTMIGLGGLVLTSLVMHVVQMVLLHLLTSGRAGAGLVSWGFPLLQCIYAVLDPACWILILLAIFTQRPPDASETERADFGSDPFLRNEHDSP
jgi:membrane-associated HD superfamily phosphohydrolase